MGEFLALMAAPTWATSVILFKRSESVSPQGLNLFKNVFAVALLALTLLVLGDRIAWERTTEDWLRIAASGVLGIAIADTLVFSALRRLGAGLLAIVDCCYAPVIVLLSVFVLHEPIGLTFALGAALVVCGVVVATRERLTLPDADRESLWKGIALGVVGVVAMGIGVVIVKPVLEGSSLVEVTLLRLVAGVLGQLVWMATVPKERVAFEALRPSPVWRTLVPAAFLGAYVSMLCWLGGFKWANASIAAVLNQLAAVFTIVLARFWLGEPLSRKRALGAAIAVGGAVVVVLV